MATCEHCGQAVDPAGQFCGSCGTPVAGAPAPPGAPTQPGTATSTGFPGPPVAGTPPPPGFAGPPVAGTPAPPGAPDAAPPGRRPRGRRRLLFGGAAVVAALVAGWFLWQGLKGESGGASSPEDAIEQFQTAVDEEDLLGAVNLIHPDEVGDLSDLVGLVSDQVGDTEAVDVDGAGVPSALNVTVDDVDVSIDEVADGIARATIESGTVEADLGDEELNFGFGDSLVSASGSASLDVSDYDGEVVLMIVRHDGRWYLSPAFTAAELALEANDLPSADLDEVADHEGGGADSPEQAVEDLAEALVDVDVEESADLITGSEPGFTNAYLDAFREQFAPDLEELQADSNVELIEATAEVLEEDGDRALVGFDEFELSYYDENDDEQVHLELDGGCLEVDEEIDGSSSTCLDDYFDDSDVDPRFSELLPEEPYVVTVKEDGAWYVSATETALDYLRNAAENLEQYHLESLGLTPVQPVELEDEVETTLPSSYATRVLTTEITDPGLYTVVLESPDDHEVTVDVEGAGDGYLFAGGEYDEDPGGVDVFSAEEGQLSLVATGDGYSDDATEDEVPFTLRVAPAEVEQGSVGFGDTASGDLGEDAIAVHEVSGLATDEFLEVEIDGPVDSVDLLEASGSSITTVYPGDDSVDLYGSTVGYLVVNGFDEGSYSVTLTEDADDEVGFSELIVGDCVDLVDGDYWDTASTFLLVDCFDAHDGQVFERLEAGGARNRAQAERQCDARYDERVASGSSTRWWFWWGAAGAPQTTCMLIDEDDLPLYGDSLF